MMGSFFIPILAIASYGCAVLIVGRSLTGKEFAVMVLGVACGTIVQIPARLRKERHGA